MNEFIVDNRSIDTMVDRYSDMLIRIAYQNTKNMKDAEDVVQDTFLKMIQSDRSFESEAHLKAWLIRVTVNRCRDLYRLAWFQKTVPLTEELPYTHQDQHEVMDAIWRLPTRYRNVIYLYYYEGYKTKEIADLFDKSINTISSQLQRARRKLRVILEEEGD